MAALYGRLQGNHGEATRMGSQKSGISSKLETWDGSIRTTLEADGSFTVEIGDKSSPREVIATGNVDSRIVDGADESIAEHTQRMERTFNPPTVRPDGPETARGGLIGQQPY